MEAQGIIIRVSNFRDFDNMVTMLTERSVISFLARGVNKITSKNRYIINNFNFVKVELLKGKDGYFLKHGEVLNSFPNIKGDFLKMASLDFVAELTNLFIEKDEVDTLYPFLFECLNSLNDGFDPLMGSLIYFAKVLKYSGYSIEVNSCQKCHKTNDIIAFSVVNGGFICRDCFDSLNDIKLEPTMLKEIRYLFLVDVDNFRKVTFSKDDCLTLFDLFNRFVKYNLQFDFKSIDLLTKF